MKCHECKILIGNDNQKIKHGNYWYHIECEKIVIEREKFQKFICDLFGLKAPGSKIWTQRKRLINEGYKDLNLIKTLLYIYKIKKIPKPKLAGLGLIIQYYDLAMEYYLSLRIHHLIMIRLALLAMSKEKLRIVISTSYHRAEQIRVLSDFVLPLKGDS